MPNILRAKCIVVGDSAVGKTCIVQSFSSDSRSFPKNYIMTFGVDLQTKKVSVPDTEDVVELFLFDSSGKDVYLDMQTKLWHHPSVACIVFDVTNQNSFNNCYFWLDAIKNVANDMTIPGVLIGTKADLKNRRIVSADTAQEFAKKSGLRYFECSVKEHFGVEEPFFYLVSEWHKLYLEKTEVFKTLS